MLTLHVDEARWRRHLEQVRDADPSLVPVAKGNGYGFGLARLAEVADQLGVDTLAVGTYAEVPGASSVISAGPCSCSPPGVPSRPVPPTTRA